MKKKVICRYIGLDPKVEESITAIAGRAPDQVEFGYPSISGEIYRVRVLTFNSKTPEEATHLAGLLAAVVGVEVYTA